MAGIELDAGPREGMTTCDAFALPSAYELGDADTCAAGDIWVADEDILTGGGDHMWSVDAAVGAPDLSVDPQGYDGENGGGVEYSVGVMMQDAAIDMEEGESAGAN